MKWLKDNWFVMTLFLVVIILASALLKQCNSTPSRNNDKKESDSLKAVIQQTQLADQHHEDSVTDFIKTLFEANQSLELERSNLDVGLIKSKTLAEKYKQEIKNNPDTVERLANCDSLVTVYDNYVFISEMKDRIDSGMIENLKEIVASQEDLLQKKQKFNDQLKSAFIIVADHYKSLYNYSGIQEKKIARLKTKQKGLFVVAGVLLIKAFIK